MTPEQIRLDALAWRYVRLLCYPYPKDAEFVRGVREGATTLDPAVVDAETERVLGEIRHHRRCIDYVRTYGYVAYRGCGPGGCEVCGRPLVCGDNPDREHVYVELTLEQARKAGVYHAGKCYHVDRCVHCGHTVGVDTSG